MEVAERVNEWWQYSSETNYNGPSARIPPCGQCRWQWTANMAWGSWPCTRPRHGTTCGKTCLDNVGHKSSMVSGYPWHCPNIWTTGQDSSQRHGPMPLVWQDRYPLTSPDRVQWHGRHMGLNTFMHNYSYDAAHRPTEHPARVDNTSRLSHLAPTAEGNNSMAAVPHGVLHHPIPAPADGNRLCGLPAALDVEGLSKGVPTGACRVYLGLI